MKLPLLAFVCINYKNSRFTLEFCKSLAAQRGLGRAFEIACTVVDNSADSPESLDLRLSLKEFEWVSYVTPDRNLGYFGGLNFGIERLPVDQLHCLVLCNNDLKFDESFCEIISSKNYDENVYAVCPDVLTPSGFHQNPHVQNRISWRRRFQFDVYYSHFFAACVLMGILKIFRPVKKNARAPLVEQEIHMGIGACYVLMRGFLKDFKKLRYPNFIYGEEAYFSDQIHTAGGILWFDPSLLVHHAESATLSKIPKRKAYEFAREGYPEYRKLL